jgi:hypothetical protein
MRTCVIGMGNTGRALGVRRARGVMWSCLASAKRKKRAQRPKWRGSDHIWHARLSAAKFPCASARKSMSSWRQAHGFGL